MSSVRINMASMDADRRIAQLARKQHGLVTRVQARRAGLSPSAGDRRLRDGAFDRVHSGVYRLAGSLDTFEQRVRAATLAIPGCVASHRAAATILGFPGIQAHVELIVARSCRARLAGVVAYRCLPLEPTDVDRFKGIPVTTVVRTLIDLPGVLNIEELVAPLEHVLAGLRVPLGHIEDRLAALGTRGRRGAANLVELVDERRGDRRQHNSRPQRRLARLIRQWGLGPVCFEQPITLDNGEVRHPDAYFPEHRLVVEVDSCRHHSSLSDWRNDHTRCSAFVALGLAVLKLPADQITHDPDGVMDVLVRSLERARPWAS